MEFIIRKYLANGNGEIVNPDQGELKRGEASLLKFFPLPY